MILNWFITISSKVILIDKKYAKDKYFKEFEKIVEDQKYKGDSRIKKISKKKNVKKNEGERRMVTSVARQPRRSVGLKNNSKRIK